MPYDIAGSFNKGRQDYATRLQTLATARQQEAAAQEQELANQETEQMNELNSIAAERIRMVARGEQVSGSPLPKSETDRMSSIADPMEITASVYSEYGAPGKAAELLEKASQIRKREQEIESAAFTDEKNRLENIGRVADLTSQFLGTAENQSEYDYGIWKLREQGIVPTEELDRLAAVPWNPDVVALLNNQAISAKDRAQQDLQRITQENNETYRARTVANAERRTANAERLQAEAARHHKAQEKAAGKGGASTTPNKQEEAMATNAVSVAFFGGKDAKKAHVAAMGAEVAAMAKAKIAENPAITYEQALQQSITDARTNGMFSEDQLTTWYGGDAGKKPRYNPGTTPETARPLPKSTAGMKKGLFYNTSKGIVQWDGQRGIPVE